jgi:threonine aldolase
MFGGGFRQAGVLAAAALYALDNHRKDLIADHENARRLAAALAKLPGIEIDVSLVQTNIVRFRVTGASPFDFVERCHAEGVHMLGSSPDRVRAVLHRDISPVQVEAAISAIQRAVPALVRS